MTNSTAYFFIAILLFAVSSVSCAHTPVDSLNKNSDKYLSFYETVDGERIHWETNFYGDEITSIYKNGKRIPDNLVDDYKHKVYEELDEMRYGGDHFSFRMPGISGEEFNFDMEEFQKEMEEMRKNLPKLDEQLEIYKFDSEEFKEQMEELKRELEENKVKIHKFKFDDEKLKEQMKELKKNLKENLIKPEDFNFHFEFKEDDEA